MHHSNQQQLRSSNMREIVKFQHVPVGSTFSVVLESYKKMGHKRPIIKGTDGSLFTKMSATVSTDVNSGKDAIFSLNDRVKLEKCINISKATIQKKN